MFSSLRRFAVSIPGVFLVALGAAAIAPRAQAQDVSQGTKITFKVPVRIPGRVLPAGTYIFTPADFGILPDSQLIEILNEDGTQFVAFIRPVPVMRETVTSSTLLSFAENPKGQEPVLTEWFYPGSTAGHRFLYSARRERRIASEPHIFIAASSDGARLVKDVSGD